MSKLTKGLVCTVLSFFVLFTAIGYAETTANLHVFGEVEATPPNELFITSSQTTETLNGATVKDLYNIHPTSVNQKITLPGKSASAIIMMTVFNNTSENYEFNAAKYADARYSNSNISFQLTNLKTCEPLRHGDVVEAGKYLSFEAKFTFMEGKTPKVSEEITALINYEF